MDCGFRSATPESSSGGWFSSGCPINNLIPEWNDLVFRGLWREALERLHKTNNFPEFTGQACPAARAKGSCVLGLNRSSRSRSITSSAQSSITGWEEGWVVAQKPPKASHGQESRGHRIRAGRPLGGRAAQPGRPSGDRVRAGRPSGRAPHVLHPQHEAGQEAGRDAPEQADGGRGRALHLQCECRRQRRKTQTFLKEFLTQP